MASKNIVSIFFLVYLSTTNSQLQFNGTIDIKVGITAGCSDGVRFMPQIRSTYDKYRQFVNFEFVPWGRTRREDGNLVCQFDDCWANRVSRCALHLLRGNADAQLNYIECELTAPFPALRLGSLLCAHNVGLNIVEVDWCITSTLGDTLEDTAEALSTDAIAAINFVPFIVFNNDINVTLHRQAFQRLESVVCFALTDDPTTGVTYCRI